MLTSSDEEAVASEEDEVIVDGQFKNVEDNAVIATHAYIAGYIARTLKKRVSNCPTCTNQLQASSSSEHTFVVENEYRPQLLIKTKTQFRRMFSNMCSLFMRTIERVILHNHFKKITVVFKKTVIQPLFM